MSRALITRFATLGLTAAVVIGSAAIAEDKKPAPTAADAAQTLQQLLEQTRNARALEQQQNAAREQQFAADRSKQAGLLSQARGEKAYQENRSKTLTAQF